MFKPVAVGFIVSVEVVTPLADEVLTLYGLAMVRVVKPAPEFISHTTVEGGVLLADAVNEAEPGAQTI